MGANITYMGTKKELAPAVCEVIEQCRPGILLDAFAGMCSVGEQVGTRRQVWCNDAQVFASEVARALFVSKDDPPSAMRAADLHYEHYVAHRAELTRACENSLKAEQDMCNSASFEEFEKKSALFAKRTRIDVARLPPKRDNLFTKIYSNSYFGLQQAIDADSIVRAISRTRQTRAISEDQKRWLTVALGRTLLKVSNSTGHFAQFLKPKEATFRRYSALRQKSVWEEWLFSIGELEGIGTVDWRSGNRAFNTDSLALLPKLRRPVRPSVIYADPPYTDDQYSRFYHLLDTLILYDYPPVNGVGLYRADRFTTPFSLKTKVSAAFETFIKSSARLGADLVLSYPSNGLMHEAGADPTLLLRKHYRRVECSRSLPHRHSTFGASKGAAKSEVTEFIYLAQL